MATKEKSLREKLIKQPTTRIYIPKDKEDRGSTYIKVNINGEEFKYLRGTHHDIPRDILSIVLGKLEWDEDEDTKKLRENAETAPELQ